ncbi:MAG TPA: OsmC family protein [Chitinophagales bacterium]|nr:OsmC family protein [Chitinophagales bacterium]
MNHHATILWKKQPTEIFTDSKYSRAHTWIFDGGIELAASSSPSVVPLPLSNELAVDPEEAFVASLSSCHMLWFLSLAAAKHFIIEQYEDHASGTLSKNEDGKLAMTEVVLKPNIIFSGETIPGKEQLDQLHHQAHEKCYIANSVRTKIRIIPA